MRSTHLALLALVGVLPAILTCGGGDATGPSVPTGLSRVSGHGQSGAVGQALAGPLVVKAVDASGSAVQGVTVAWVVASGGGSFSPGTSTTDAQGLASSSWTLGPSVGLHSAIASIAGNASVAPVSFTATALAGPAAKVAFTVQPSTAAVGAALSPAVQVTVQDAQGNTVTSATTSIGLAITPGTGTSGAVLGGTLTQTAVGGVATFGNLTIDRLGSGYTLTASASGLAGATSGAFAVSAGAAARLAYSVQPSAVVAGAAITPAMQVTVQDASGNTVTGATNSVSLAITAGTGTVGAVLGGTLTRAAVNGVATFSDISINKAGSGYTLTATAAGLTGAASGAFAVTPGAAAKLAFTVQPGAAAIGATLSPAVQVTVQDALGNTVPGATNSVTMAITAGTGTAGAVLGGTLTQAAAGGVATFANLSIDRAGAGYTLTATASGLTGAASNAFSVSPGYDGAWAGRTGLDSTITLMIVGNRITQASFGWGGISACGGSVSGRTTSNYTPGYDVAGGSFSYTTSASPITYTLSGTFSSATAVSGNLSVTFSQPCGSGSRSTTWSATLAAGPGQPAKLAVTVQPSAVVAGVAISPAVQVTVQDYLGNTVVGATNSVTLAITAGSGTAGAALGGTLTQTAVNGVATFGDLSIDKAGSGYTLTATAAGLSGATSSAFAVTPGAAARLAFSVQPSAVVAGAALSPAVQVTVQDALGNTVTSATTSVTLGITPGTGTSGAVLGGTPTRAAVGGVASFADLTVDRAGTGYTLTATATGLTGAASSAFTVSQAYDGAWAGLTGIDSTITLQIAGNRITQVSFGWGGISACGGSVSGRTTSNFTPGTSVASGSFSFSASASPITYTLSGTFSSATAVSGNLSVSFSQPCGSGSRSTTWSAVAGGTPGVPTRVAITVQPSAVAAGAAIAPAVQVTVQDYLGNTVAGATNSVTLAITAGTGTAGAALGGTLTQAAVNGVASFGDLSIDRAGSGYTLSATAAGLSGATSSAFAVSPGTAAKLAFSAQPGNAAIATPISPAVQVTVQDALGNTATSATTGVTLGITPGTGTGGAALGGTLTRAAVAGVATFADLTVDLVGTGYTLTAAATGLASVTSSPFGITLSAPLTTTQAVPATAGTVNTLIPTFTPVTASGGTLPYAFALTGGTLPTGMSFNTGTGAVSGTPATTLAATVFTVTVTDAATATSAKTFTLTVNGALTTTQAVPSTSGTVNTLIPTFTPVTASGGTLPYAFALSGGTLPSGMSFNTGTGAVSGTPTAMLAATVFTVTVTDAASATSAKTFTLTVTDACAFATAPAITIGQTVDGTLATSDCALSGKYTDQYALTLTGTTSVQIELTSPTFDTYLKLVDAATSAVVTLNDDDALSGTYNSRINTLLSAHTYIVQATSYGTGVTGAYQLRVCNSAPTFMTLGQTLNGTLASSDCGLAATGEGMYIDRYQFTVTQPTNVTLTETSAAFDAYLWLMNATETSVLASDDDGAGGTDARIVMAGGTTLQPGTYIAWPSSFDPASTGAYQLSLTGATDYCSIATPISNPQTTAGELTAADCGLSDGSYADRWQITLAAPTALRIDMTSTAFDAFLFLRDASGNTVASDDDGGGGTNARIEGTFPAGTYIIWANSFVPAATGAYGLAVSAAPAGTVNLRIDQLYLVQSTQDFTGAVPLVSGRDALLRVFVRADQANTAAPEVRVRTYSGGVLQNTRTITAPAASVPTVLSEGSLTSSWNVLIPAAEVQPGVQILADVDPTNVIAEGNESDNAYPASGTPVALDVRTMPTLYITLVPIAQSANGLTGNVSVGNQDSFLNLTRRMWPFTTVSPAVHATYTTTTPGALLSDGTNWSPVLSELLALRTAEASSRNYFGIVKVAYSSGVAGLGYIGLPTAMGWDYLPSGDGTVAHELGHNFNRLHAPCGGPAGPDPNYPYAAGAIGVYGYDVAAAVLKARTMPDLMTYCHPEWISDYTYHGALDFIVAHPTSPTAVADPVPGVLIWGRIDDGTLVLEPAVDVTAVPTPLPPSGPYRLLGTDASGRTILNLAFAPDEVADAPTPTRHFAFVIPKGSLGGAGLSALQLTGPDGASASLRSSGATDNAALVDAATTATRRAAGLVEVRWDAVRYPLAVIRSAATGEILSFARGGVVSVPDGGAEIDVVLSDGVRSAARRLAPRP